MKIEHSKLGMPVVAIFDSNSIWGGFSFPGRDWDIVRGHVAKKRARILFPEVVVQERIKQMSKDVLEETLRELKIVDKLQNRLKLSNIIFPSIDIDAISKQCGVHMSHEYSDDQLRAAIRDLGGEIVPLPQPDVEALTRAALHRLKPFKESGDGVGDYLIWRTIIDVVNANVSVDFVFVTSNYTDFSASKGNQAELHPHLADDLPAGTNMTILPSVASLAEYLETQFSDAKHHLRQGEPEPTTPLKLEGALEVEILQVCTAFLERYVVGHEFDDGVEDSSPEISFIGKGIPRGLIEASIESIAVENVEDFSVDEVFGESTSLISTSVTGILGIEGYMLKSELVHADLDPVIRVLNVDHNRHMASMGYAIDFAAYFSLRKDGAALEVMELNWIRLY